MKFKLPIGVCILISLVLVLVGLGYGTVSGFSEERRQVTDLLSGDSGLNGVLSYRGADGLNLCVVADRHLSGSASVESLRQIAKTLNGSAALSDKQAKNQALDSAVAAVLNELQAADSYRQSERDQRYAAMLKSDLASLSQTELLTTYERDAVSFNQKLAGTPMGKLAGWLGVQPCELYQ